VVTPRSLTPSAPHYNGKVVILVDETTQSSAEFPGGLSSYISGLGVFYPDKRPTQRVGVIPDIWLTPTIAGLRGPRRRASSYLRPGSRCTIHERTPSRLAVMTAAGLGFSHFHGGVWANVGVFVRFTSERCHTPGIKELVRDEGDKHFR
jgi:hypothetical protein